MKKRWFVVILTIGLLLHVLPLSVLALSPDPTITDSDGTLLGWSDLSTVSDVLDDSREQQLAVVDADNDEEAADDRSAGNLTPKTLDEESGDEESGGEESDDEESDDDDPADADRDEATDDLPAGNPTPPPHTYRSGSASACRYCRRKWSSSSYYGTQGPYTTQCPSAGRSDHHPSPQ